MIPKYLNILYYAYRVNRCIVAFIKMFKMSVALQITYVLFLDLD